VDEQIRLGASTQSGWLDTVDITRYVISCTNGRYNNWHIRGWCGRGVMLVWMWIYQFNARMCQVLIAIGNGRTCQRPTGSCRFNQERVYSPAGRTPKCEILFSALGLQFKPSGLSLQHACKNWAAVFVSVL
jgi:hypothetical protein